MVDGELFVPNDYFQYYYYSWKDNPDFYGTLSLRASRKKSNEQQGFLIQLRDRVFITGKHHLFTNPNTSNYVRMIGYNHQDSLHFFEYTNFANDSNNYLNLMRLDTISRIASGTFQFQLINPEDNADTIKVTEGRFDVRY